MWLTIIEGLGGLVAVWVGLFLSSRRDRRADHVELRTLAYAGATARASERQAFAAEADMLVSNAMSMVEQLRHDNEAQARRIAALEAENARLRARGARGAAEATTVAHGRDQTAQPPSRPAERATGARGGSGAAATTPRTGQQRSQGQQGKQRPSRRTRRQR